MSIQSACGEVRVGSESCGVEIAGPACKVDLEYRAARKMLQLPVIIRNSGESEILWSPVQIRSRVTGSVVIGGEEIHLKNCDGYVDYLESSFLPWATPVRTLYWGRLHHPDLDLVYMRAGNEPGKRVWSNLAVYGGKSVTQFQDLVIESREKVQGRSSRGKPQAGYCASAFRGDCRVCVNVRRETAVQDASFMDHLDMKSEWMRYLLKRITRNPRSTKWLSFANVELNEGGTTRYIQDVPMIDEFALI